MKWLLAVLRILPLLSKAKSTYQKAREKYKKLVKKLKNMGLIIIPILAIFFYGCVAETLAVVAVAGWTTVELMTDTENNNITIHEGVAQNVSCSFDQCTITFEDGNIYTVQKAKGQLLYVPVGKSVKIISKRGRYEVEY